MQFQMQEPHDSTCSKMFKLQNNKTEQLVSVKRNLGCWHNLCCSNSLKCPLLTGASDGLVVNGLAVIVPNYPKDASL